MNQAAVTRALIIAGLFRGPWALDDELYETVSPAFVEQAAVQCVDKWLPLECTELRDIGGGKTARFPKWVKQGGDCDNSGKVFSSFLSLCQWAKAATATDVTGNIAAGFLRFVPDDAGGAGHLVSWFIDHAEIAHVFDFGLMALRSLSPAELKSIYGGETV